MILYSVIPVEVVFQGLDTHKPQYEDIELQGVSMQVERISSSEARIMRLYSVNPQDYLNPQLYPGTLIEYGPTILRS
jgi:hypothetical protein